jgi:hypothetical protein
MFHCADATPSPSPPKFLSLLLLLPVLLVLLLSVALVLLLLLLLLWAGTCTHLRQRLLIDDLSVAKVVVSGEAQVPGIILARVDALVEVGEVQGGTASIHHSSSSSRSISVVGGTYRPRGASICNHMPAAASPQAAVLVAHP